MENFEIIPEKEEPVSGRINSQRNTRFNTNKDMVNSRKDIFGEESQEENDAVQMDDKNSREEINKPKSGISHELNLDRGSRSIKNIEKKKGNKSSRLFIPKNKEFQNTMDKRERVNHRLNCSNLGLSENQEDELEASMEDDSLFQESHKSEIDMNGDPNSDEDFEF